MTLKERRTAVNDELKRHFKPEFLNRLDDIVIFNPLDLRSDYQHCRYSL